MKFTFVVVLTAIFLVAAFVGYTGLTFVPESRMRFNSLRLVEATRTGCVGQDSSLDFDIQYDSVFRVGTPDTELPANWDVGLTPLERLSFFFSRFINRGELPMALSIGSLSIQSTEDCVILVDENTTYNVLPGSPLEVAKLVGENGSTRMVYVSSMAKWRQITK